MSKVDWKGDELLAKIRGQAAEAMKEIAGRVVSEAKQELRPGHGVVTGDLRDSIKADEPQVSGDHITVPVGSDLNYAMPVHQGHGSTEGYHFLTNAVERVKGREAEGIMQKHVKVDRAAGGSPSMLKTAQGVYNEITDTWEDLEQKAEEVWDKMGGG